MDERQLYEQAAENIDPNELKSDEKTRSWGLVTVKLKKRKSFLKYLEIDLEKKPQLPELILEIILLEESVYEDMVLICSRDFAQVRSYLKQVEHFQSVQRLKPNEVSQMLKK